jgi:hypothetical protein
MNVENIPTKYLYMTAEAAMRLGQQLIAEGRKINEAQQHNVNAHLYMAIGEDSSGNKIRVRIGAP